MGLTEYRKKRSFANTPEPTEGKADKNTLHFVVQKHAASRLHYDFRLEMNGTLKSWAIPKGPSLNPAEKRLAMLVEDHPLDYRNFEGTIPEGNYGAGTVIIWDQGTYEPVEKTPRKVDNEKILKKAFASGQLKIVMHGKKLKGEFVLVRMSKAENAWLLIKHRDEFASSEDITDREDSVVSGKTLQQVADEAKLEKMASSSETKAKTRKGKQKRTHGPHH